MFDTDDSSPERATRERLLDAAGRVFAERGFRDSTVRDICTLAGANVAAVNYHFRDKEGLYVAVLREAHTTAENRHPFEGDFNLLSPEDRLRAFVRIMLKRMLDKGKPAWFGKLMAREMVEPTAALDSLVDQNIRPKSEFLKSIVRSVMSEPVPDERRVRAHARSVIGQCLFYHQNRSVIERLFDEVQYDEAGIDEIARHVAEFSLAAIRAKPVGAEAHQ